MALTNELIESENHRLMCGDVSLHVDEIGIFKLFDSFGYFGEERNGKYCDMSRHSRPKARHLSKMARPKNTAFGDHR